MAEEFDQLFLGFSIKKLNQLASRIQDCLGRLTEEQIWTRGGEAQNAAGNLVLHLCGNVRQWIISGIGGKPDIRVRDREFAARGGIGPSELSERLGSTVAEAVAVLQGLTGHDLSRRVRIQDFDLTVLEAVYHVVEHFAQHTGQIVFFTKMATGADLGYYKNLGKAKAAVPSDPTP
jgi:hypothetical protein